MGFKNDVCQCAYFSRFLIIYIHLTHFEYDFNIYNIYNMIFLISKNWYTYYNYRLKVVIKIFRVITRLTIGLPLI